MEKQETKAKGFARSIGVGVVFLKALLFDTGDREQLKPASGTGCNWLQESINLRTVFRI